MSAKGKARRGYWYEFYETYCVLCARTDVEKERVYNRPKPKRWWERHHVEETSCSSHFL